MNPEPTASESAPDLCHLFVDEAGTPDIFDAKGRINIGKPGCSRFFFLGMLEVDDPEPLTEALKTLREQLLTDPYFASAESFKPERKKTSLLLHAKDDLPEVRVKVFELHMIGSAACDVNTTAAHPINNIGVGHADLKHCV
jgi:hypothetical protein